MFRFETLESWKMSVEVAEIIFNVADELEEFTQGIIKQVEDFLIELGGVYV